MTELAKLYNAFFNTILPAYVENEVPKDTALPYITYTVGRNAYGVDGLQSVRVWTNSTSFSALWGCVDQIEKLIPESGGILELEDKTGGIFLHRGTPFIQYVAVPDAQYDNLKVAHINLVARTYVL